MQLEAGTAGKCTVAVLALERLLSRVDAAVPHHCVLVVALVGADSAEEFLHPARVLSAPDARRMGQGKALGREFHSEELFVGLLA